MELTYQNAVRLPSSYCVLTEEEMTYVDGGKVVITFHPEAIVPMLTNMAVNMTYMLAAGAFTSVVNGVVKGYRDGLSPLQTLTHFWGRQNTGGKVASVLVGGLAAGYAGLQAYLMYTTVKQLIDAVKSAANPQPAPEAIPQAI